MWKGILEAPWAAWERQSRTTVCLQRIEGSANPAGATLLMSEPSAAPLPCLPTQRARGHDSSCLALLSHLGFQTKYPKIPSWQAAGASVERRHPDPGLAEGSANTSAIPLHTETPPGHCLSPSKQISTQNRQENLSFPRGSPATCFPLPAKPLIPLPAPSRSYGCPKK